MTSIIPDVRRRDFLCAAMAAPLGAWLTLRAAPAFAAQRIEDLASGFASPPDGARPWVYWFWVNGNVTRAGITADLEAMARVGIGGVLIMDVNPGTPAGPILYGTERWLQHVGFALAEAQRLGLEVNLYNAAGWSGSAGPWVTPELSMQKLVWSVARVGGGRHVSLALEQPQSFPGYYRDLTVLAFPTPGDDSYRIPDIGYKAAYEAKLRRHVRRQGIPPLPVDAAELADAFVIDGSSIIDLSDRFRAGQLDWDAPAGDWTVMRFGHTSTGSDNHPVAESARGLECDKMSRHAIEVHFSHLLARVIEISRELRQSPLVSTHIDSWEAGSQNWTPAFRQEFRKRRGYDPFFYLPIVSGRVVESADISERFLWDLRKTVSDLVIENYAGGLKALAHRHGLRLSIEAYDSDPCDQIAYGGQADEPQGEFWYGPDFYPEVHRSWAWCANMTSAGHVYGRPVIAAEAFTAMPGEDWQAHPGSMKALGDWALCQGINRFIFHRYAMQPWVDRAPGMTMGPWGVHYERTQTWWEESRPWHEYIARCQYLLRQGLHVADLLYLMPEGAPMRFSPPHVDMASGAAPLTPGYNLDGCSSEAVFSRVSVRDGWIAMPDGMRYRAMVLPDPNGDMPGAGAMTLELLRRLKQLVEQGMILIGAPPRGSPSLQNHPACDAEVRRLADEIWADCNGVQVTERALGKGRVIWGPSPEQVLAKMGIVPDFECGADTPFNHTHRRLADGTDIYFVANTLATPAEARCRFRVSGKVPEYWDPETGRCEIFAAYDDTDDGISVPLHLEPQQSLFVMFRPGKASRARRATEMRRDDRKLSDGELAALRAGADGSLRVPALHAGRYSLRMADGSTRHAVAAAPLRKGIVGPWTISFAEGRGAPPQIDMPVLMSWTDHPDDGVRHFSGKAIYRKAVDIPGAMLASNRSLTLDLGEVEVAARIRLNDREIAVLWKPPYRIDITPIATRGINNLEIEVVNLWPNRIIGDQKLPEDAKWEKISFHGVPTDFGSRLVEWPSWLLEGKPSPTGRQTFSTWKSWSADAPLLRSGLIGPVMLESCEMLIFAAGGPG